MERTKAELEFIDQMTRKMLVKWGDAHMTGMAKIPMEEDVHILQGVGLVRMTNPYLEHAMAKGWVTKDGTRLTSVGWQTAARFLKR